MTYKSISLLDEGSLERIHKESLRVLENVGVRVEDPECIRILKKKGAKVDGQSNIVRLPSEMVLETMIQVTKEFELVNANGVRFSMPSERPMLQTRIMMPEFLDFRAEKARVPTRQDVINLCRLAKALPEVKFTYAVDYPTADVPEKLSIIDTVGLAYAITGNAGVCAPLNVDAARAWIDISALAIGSDNFDKDPGVLVVLCTTGPLQFIEENAKTIRYAVEKGVPFAAEPMPMAGAVAPFTLAGTLVVDNAEALFLFTMANAIKPGAKVTYSCCGSIMNMATGNISMAAPESMLLCSGETALARFYGLSTYRPTCFSESCYPDVQAGIEKSAFTLMNLLSGGDIIMMGGSLNNVSCHSLEQVLIDHDVWEFANRFVKEIEVNDETLAYEVIERVGAGGSFIEDEHVLHWLRSGEHYYGGSFNRTGQFGDENTMLARAHRRVEDILNQPFEFGAPPEAVKRIKQYVRDEAKSMGLAAPEWTD